MTHPAQAYRDAFRRGLSARELEALVLSQCAGDLEAAGRRLPDDTLPLMRALAANSQAWFTLMEGLANAAGQLPEDQVRSLRQLAAFVQQRSRTLAETPTAAGIDVLVQINRNLAAGLQGQPAR